MASSSIPAAIDGALALIGARAGLSGVTIYDGPSTVAEPTEYIAVGVARPDGVPWEDSSVVTGGQVADGLGNQHRSEAYSIGCRVSSWTGSASMKTIRDRAFGMFAEVEAAIKGDATLGGAVQFANVGSTFVGERFDSGDAVVTIAFSIDVAINRI